MFMYIYLLAIVSFLYNYFFITFSNNFSCKFTYFKLFKAVKLINLKE